MFAVTITMIALTLTLIGALCFDWAENTIWWSAGGGKCDYIIFYSNSFLISIICPYCL